MSNHIKIKCGMLRSDMHEPDLFCDNPADLQVFIEQTSVGIAFWLHSCNDCVIISLLRGKKYRTRSLVNPNFDTESVVNLRYETIRTRCP